MMHGTGLQGNITGSGERSERLGVELRSTQMAR